VLTRPVELEIIGISVLWSGTPTGTRYGMQIPTESGHDFRRQSGQCSDRKPAGFPI
jgi:hypothetical protein